MKGKRFTPREREALNETHGKLRWWKVHDSHYNKTARQWLDRVFYVLASERCSYCGQPTEDIQCRWCGARVEVRI